MPDRQPTTDAEPRARRAGVNVGRASREEALALADRAGAVPDGLTVLRHASLECAAVLLGVPPRTVDAVRRALEDPALAEEAALRWARAEGKRPAPRRDTAAASTPRSPEALLSAARARDGGLSMLLDAAPECAAIAFGVHPELVRRARELATRSS